jgi:spermidine synthase
VTYFRDLFDDAFAYVATTPSYFGGSMSYGWASDDKKLRNQKLAKIARRYKKAGTFPTRYWSPEMQAAAFALPTYIRELVEAS